LATQIFHGGANTIVLPRFAVTLSLRQRREQALFALFALPSFKGALLLPVVAKKLDKTNKKECGSSHC
jgi:hypothetical protein